MPGDSRLTPEDHELLTEAVAYWADALATTDRNERVAGILDRLKPAVMKSGRVLTDPDFEALADEAERGYDVRVLLIRKVLLAHDGTEFEADDFPTLEDGKKASEALQEIKLLLSLVRDLKADAEAVLVLTEQPGNELPDEVFNLAAAAHRLAVLEGR